MPLLFASDIRHIFSWPGSNRMMPMTHCEGHASTETQEKQKRLTPLFRSCSSIVEKIGTAKIKASPSAHFLKCEIV